MALIRCVECGNEISDHAAACPKCGMPVEKSAPSVNSVGPVIRTLRYLFFVCIGVFVLLIIVAAIMRSKEGDKSAKPIAHIAETPSQQSQPAKPEPNNCFYKNCFVSQRIKSQHSAQISPICGDIDVERYIWRVMLDHMMTTKGVEPIPPNDLIRMAVQRGYQNANLMCGQVEDNFDGTILDINGDLLFVKFDLVNNAVWIPKFSIAPEAK